MLKHLSSHACVTHIGQGKSHGQVQSTREELYEGMNTRQQD